MDGVPQSVIDDANRLASTLYRGRKGRRREFADRLLSNYQPVKDKDVLVLFNSGGWGTAGVSRSPGWRTILEGMRVEIESQGYAPVLVDYRRTRSTFAGWAREAFELLRRYPNKAREMAHILQFLLEHIPGLWIILAAESNGSVIANAAMRRLRKNPHVISIQTGPPAWERPQVLHRTLVLRGNGGMYDSYSVGDILTLVRANLRSILRLSKTSEPSGMVLNSLHAPGHEYSWKHLRVADAITFFLQEHLREKVRQKV